MSAIEIINLTKKFGNKTIIDKMNFSIKKGEIVGLLGPSGAGKSTLIRMILGLEAINKANKPILVDANLAKKKQLENSIKILDLFMQYEGNIVKNAKDIRIKTAVIFQQFNLINRESVLNNVLTGIIAKISFWRAFFNIFNQSEIESACKALKEVGLKDYINKKAGDLSGGQQQRVAIARIIFQNADIILADEPIASLDPQNAKLVMKYLKNLQQNQNKTVLVSLHQVNYALNYFDRIIGIKDGKIALDELVNNVNRSDIDNLYTK